jgi:phosphoenolpyruvate carboxylase
MGLDGLVVYSRQCEVRSVSRYIFFGGSMYFDVL